MTQLTPIAMDPPMIPVTFRGSTIPVKLSELESFIRDGLVEPVRFDGKDFYLSMDVAIDLHNDGLISGGRCGPGWEGSKGNCKRTKRDLRGIAKTVGKAALVAGGIGAAAYIGSKIAKNPKKAAVIGSAAIGAGFLARRNVKKAVAGWDEAMQDIRSARARRVPVHKQMDLFS